MNEAKQVRKEKNDNGIERVDSAIADAKQAVKYYREAADQGNASAQFNLGVCYDEGFGVERDRKQAVQCYQLAANQGYTQAQFNLGVCYAAGIGVEENAEKAVEYYQLAAKQGHAKAQFNLGLCYDEGIGVKKDRKKAVECYQLAANQGHAKAQRQIRKLNQLSLFLPISGDLDQQALSAAMNSVSFSPDGRRLAGHIDLAEYIDNVPDGRQLPEANTVHLWEVDWQAPLGAPLTDHPRWVESAAFRPDGRRPLPMVEPATDNRPSGASVLRIADHPPVVIPDLPQSLPPAVISASVISALTDNKAGQAAPLPEIKEAKTSTPSAASASATHASTAAFFKTPVEQKSISTPTQQALSARLAQLQQQLDQAFPADKPDQATKQEYQTQLQIYQQPDFVLTPETEQQLAALEETLAHLSDHREKSCCVTL